jgi:hypothetical protein
MLWLLTKLSAWMNRPYDYTAELERLRERHKKRLDSERDDDA